MSVRAEGCFLGDHMHFVSDSEATRVLTFPILIAAFEAAHRRPKAEVSDAYLGSETDQYVIRSAVDRGRYMASKMFTSFPSNLAHGKRPAVQAVCVLFDGTNGKPLAVIDGTEITHWRTAADSALGAKYLAAPNPETMLVVGAGEMAAWLVRAHRTVHPSLNRVMVWNRTTERAERLVATLRQEGIAATTARDLDVAFHGVGDILQPITNGAIREADVLGDLYDLAAGTVKGRLDAQDITFFKNAGGGHLDLMTCEVVFQQLGKDLA
jgi:ornithine cyclodeaminase/alanine dehydrogenase-like protein (mu-crystallin family)